MLTIGRIEAPLAHPIFVRNHTRLMDQCGVMADYATKVPVDAVEKPFPSLISGKEMAQVLSAPFFIFMFFSGRP